MSGKNLPQDKAVCPLVRTARRDPGVSIQVDAWLRVLSRLLTASRPNDRGGGSVKKHERPIGAQDDTRNADARRRAAPEGGVMRQEKGRRPASHGTDGVRRRAASPSTIAHLRNAQKLLDHIAYLAQDCGMRTAWSERAADVRAVSRLLMAGHQLCLACEALTEAKEVIA